MIDPCHLSFSTTLPVACKNEQPVHKEHKST
uniref:Uncharacterized protein n=1 Tax=Arundo donax TaxID=35708 RepID=A0A0A9HXK4_ARUDO